MKPLHDHDAEQALLGSVLLMPGVLTALLNRSGVRPEHLADARHQAALQAMATIHDRGAQVDSLTLGAELERVMPGTDGQAMVHGLISLVPDAQNWEAYAERIRDLARRRQLRQAAMLIAKAADEGDESHVAQAEALLTTPDDQEVTTWGPNERAARYRERKASDRPASWPYPFRTLDRWTGGLRRKQIVLVGGWSSHGKSVIYDQILHCMAGHQLRVHSYITEMSEEERTDREVTRYSGIPLSAVQAGRVPPAELQAEEAALKNIRFGVTEAGGWTVDEIARHIKWNRWDVAGVDIIHEIPHDEATDERGLTKIFQTLRGAAKQAGCALIGCVHLNDNRVTTPQRPAPVLRDIRGSGMFQRGADVVLFVHRDDNEHGMPTERGMLFAAKIRNGQPNAMAMTFDGDTLQFKPTVGDASAAF